MAKLVVESLWNERLKSVEKYQDVLQPIDSIDYSGINANTGEELITLSELIESPYKTEEYVLNKINEENLHKYTETLLSERENDMLWRSFRGETLEQIGAVYHLTRERVRQINQKSLRRLIHSHRRDQFIQYFESGDR